MELLLEAGVPFLSFLWLARQLCSRTVRTYAIPDDETAATPSLRHSSLLELYATSQPDLSAVRAGLVTRRWLYEMTLCLSASCCLLLLLLTPSSSHSTLHTTCRAAAAAAHLMTALCARILGGYTPPAALLPRYACVEFRPPRFKAYTTHMRTLLSPVRNHLLLCGVSVVASIVYRMRYSVWDDVCSDWICFPSASPLHTAHSLAALLALALPIAAACVAAYTQCAWARSDFIGHVTPAQHAWMWPPACIGQHPSQRLPPRASVHVEDAAIALKVRSAHVTRSVVAAAEALEAVDSGAPAVELHAGLGSLSTPVSDDETKPRPPPRSSRRRSLTPFPNRSASTPVSKSVPPSMRAVPHAFPDSASMIPRSRRRMRIVILTIGTRGDVQPFIALGCALREAGHDVTISTTEDFREFIIGFGLGYVGTGTPRIQQPSSWLTVTSVAGMIRNLSREQTEVEYKAVCNAFLRAVTEPHTADVIIGTAMTMAVSCNLSEGLGIPAFMAKLAPELPSAASVSPGWKDTPIGWLNLMKCYAYWLDVAGAVNAAGMSGVETAFRQEVLGLPKTTLSKAIENVIYTPQLLGFSSNVFPKPCDYPQWAFQCGFWMTNEAGEYERRVPAHLRDFMRQQQPGSDSRWNVAVVTFGSMVNRFRTGFIADVVAELRARNFRVLVITGWGATPEGLDEDDPNVLCIEEAPHDWVFDEAFLVVHHGGAGTTARALSCGKPSIIIPILRWADQMQWGRMVHEMGVGTVIEELNPTRARIRAAITHVLYGDTKRAPRTGTIIGDRSNAMGACVRAERSTEAVCTLLESCLCNMVLPPADADAIHPLAGPLPPPKALTPVQRMCVQHCVPCHRVRAMLTSKELSAHRSAAVATRARLSLRSAQRDGACSAAASDAAVWSPASADAAADTRRRMDFDATPAGHASLPDTPSAAAPSSTVAQAPETPAVGTPDDSMLSPGASIPRARRVRRSSGDRGESAEREDEGADDVVTLRSSPRLARRAHQARAAEGGRR